MWYATIQTSGHYKMGIILRKTRKTNPNQKYMKGFIGNTWSNKTEIHELIFNKTSGFALGRFECTDCIPEDQVLSIWLISWGHDKHTGSPKFLEHKDWIDTCTLGVGADIRHTPVLGVALPRPCSAPFSPTIVSIYHAFDYSTEHQVWHT